VKQKFDLSNVDQADREEFLKLLDKMLRDSYLKGYNAGLAKREETTDDKTI
jgi:hypothetical protein